MMAMDCLAGYPVWLQEYGETIPTPSALNTIHTEPVAQAYNVSVHLIVVDVAEYVTTHFQDMAITTVSLPTSLYHMALEQAHDLSDVLQRALTHI